MHFPAVVTLLAAVTAAKHLFDCEHCALEENLRSPTIALGIDTDNLVLAIKQVGGSVAVVAKVSTDDKLRSLLLSWAKQDIELSPMADDLAPNEKVIPSAPRTSDVADTIGRSIERLLTSASSSIPAVDVYGLHHAFSLPPYINLNQFNHFEQAARQAGLLKTDTALIDHTDKWVHTSYNALYCRYHSHPHSDLCTSDLLDRGIFDALFVDYSHDVLIISWLELIMGSIVFRRKAITSAELGAKNTRDRKYWLKLENEILGFLRAIDEDHDGRDIAVPADELGRNQIIFSGSMGGDQLLRSFLKDALAGTRFDFEDSLIQDVIDPAVVGAHSAATAVKAILDAPEPMGCQEPAACVELREKIYEDARKAGAKDEL